MQNSKSPGNDGFTNDFYETFWNKIKHSRERKKLSTSQRQAVIKLTEKKERVKRFIKNRPPISLLYVDYKIIGKAL